MPNIPKRKWKKSPKKGGGGLKSYDVTRYRSVYEESKTCNSTGCTNDSGFPRTTSRVDNRRALTLGVTSTNNKQNRPWTNWRYTRRSAHGGHHNRVNRAWWYGYGINDYGYPVMNATNVYTSGNRGFDHPWAFTSFSEPTTKAEANAIAEAKLLSSLEEARTQWNLAVTLGEARETASMIAHTARRLGSSFLSFKKGKITDAWRQLRGKERVPVHHQENFRSLKKRAKRDTWADESASAWMEFNYGWTPLLGDIDSAAKYLAEKHVRGYFPVQEVSRAHRARRTSSVNYGTGNSYRYVDRARFMSHVRRTYELYPDWAKKPSTLNELGFTDPYTLAWELLPLSFVVDWFVNVGQVLQSLHEFRQWRVKRGIYSSRSVSAQERALTRNWVAGSGQPISPATEILPEQYVKLTWTDRSVISTLPTAVPLRIKVGNPFDLKSGQLASAAALLRFAFR